MAAESPTDYCARLIAIQNKIHALGATCVEADLVTQFEIGCGKEYRVAYRGLVTNLAAGAVLTMLQIETKMQILFSYGDGDNNKVRPKERYYWTFFSDLSDLDRKQKMNPRDSQSRTVF
jgi:hypothetical protein